MVQSEAGDVDVQGVVVVGAGADDVLLNKGVIIGVEVDELAGVDDLLPDREREALVAVDGVEDADVPGGLELAVCNALGRNNCGFNTVKLDKTST